MSELAVKTQFFEIRMATHSDIDEIAAPGGLAEQFFYESEFRDFTELDYEVIHAELIPRLKDGSMPMLVACCQGVPVGFLIFSIARYYTKDPLAMLFLFYIQPVRRYTPLGRALLEGAEEVARINGACVFYAGATANIGRGVDERLMNMLDKFGYKRLGGVARKVLRTEA